MAKAKKTKEENLEEVVPNFDTTIITQENWEQCEWCFQFDNDAPQIFAWTDDDQPKNEEPKVIFTISNTKNSYINFTDKETGRVFKIFSRQLSEEGIKMRENQKVAFQQFKSQNDGSENKEA